VLEGVGQRKRLHRWGMMSMVKEFGGDDDGEVKDEVKFCDFRFYDLN